jgi:hypothetical protein
VRPTKLDNTLVEKSVALQRLLVAAAILAYIVVFIVLYPLYGPMVSALSGIPTMTTAYLYGKWYGFLGVFIYLGLNVVLFMVIADLSMQESIYHILSLGSLMLIGMAFIFGYMGDITKELREKINEYERNAHK